MWSGCELRCAGGTAARVEVVRLPSSADGSSPAFSSADKVAAELAEMRFSTEEKYEPLPRKEEEPRKVLTFTTSTCSLLVALQPGKLVARHGLLHRTPPEIAVLKVLRVLSSLPLLCTDSQIFVAGFSALFSLFR